MTTWRHYFRCLGQTSNPKIVGHRGESYTGEVVTPNQERPRFAPVCSRCVEAMEYVGSEEGEARSPPHFSNLDPHEHEMLAHAVQEMAEAIDAVSRVLMHGLDSHHPNHQELNRERVAEELGHVQAATDMLVQLGVVDPAIVQRSRDDKFKRVGRWLHHVTISGGTVAVIRSTP